VILKHVKNHGRAVTARELSMHSIQNTHDWQGKILAEIVFFF
jgi:hypothetical protein